MDKNEEQKIVIEQQRAVIKEEEKIKFIKNFLWDYIIKNKDTTLMNECGEINIHKLIKTAGIFILDEWNSRLYINNKKYEYYSILELDNIIEELGKEDKAAKTINIIIFLKWGEEKIYEDICELEVNDNSLSFKIKRKAGLGAEVTKNIEFKDFAGYEITETEEEPWIKDKK